MQYIYKYYYNIYYCIVMDLPDFVHVNAFGGTMSDYRAAVPE